MSTLGKRYPRKKCPGGVRPNVVGLKHPAQKAPGREKEVRIMSAFVYLFRTSEAEQREHMGTPELAQKSMEAWLAWMGELEAKGHLKDRGQPLERAGKVVRGPNVITDGPYVEAKDLIAGYIVVEARDLEQAVALSIGCPMLGGEGSVEVRPVMAF